MTATSSDVVLPAEEQPADVQGVPVVVGDGLPAELFLPDGTGPWPGVVVGAEAYGPNHATRTVAAALAARGFAVLLPDYYRGSGPTDREDYDDFTGVMTAIASLDFPRAALDLAAGVGHLAGRDDVDAARVGVWGYCTGATLALLATVLRHDVAAAVLFFPSQPRFPTHDDTRPVDPVDLLWAVRAPTLLQYGSEDMVLQPGDLDEIRRRAEVWDVPLTVVEHPGANHAFNAPRGPLRHDRADRDGWARALAFVQQHLA
ncbi:MAG: carboxymethylenebutenolidase [Frankiales bacterium]|nr:carboxymethylenebutenolidase [Frankiales bacterium]